MKVLIWKPRVATSSLKMPSSLFFADEIEPLKIHYKWRKGNLQHTSVKQRMVPCALGSAGNLPWEIRLWAKFLQTQTPRVSQGCYSCTTSYSERDVSVLLVGYLSHSSTFQVTLQWPLI